VQTSRKRQKEKGRSSGKAKAGPSTSSGPTVQVAGTSGPSVHHAGPTGPQVNDAGPSVKVAAVRQKRKRHSVTPQFPVLKISFNKHINQSTSQKGVSHFILTTFR